MPSFARTLAWRYLRGAQGGESRRFLRFVTWAAVGGVAVGVAALLLALMIVRGFSREIEAKIVGFGQHVQVESYLGEPLARADTLVPRLAAIDGVRSVTPAAIEFTLLRGRRPEAAPPGTRAPIDGVLLWGTPPGGQPFLQSNIAQGRFAFDADAAGRPGVVVGADLAEAFGIRAGDVVTAFSMRGLRGGELTERPRVRQYHVAGVYETGLADFDARFVFTSLGDARSLFGYAPDEASRYDLVLDDIAASPAVAEAITTELGAPIFARSIYDVFRNLFAWVALQQSVIPLVISVLVLVAAFNIVGALLMVILEKTREIGILLGMGASRKAVRRLFVWFGLLVGVVGAGSGVAVALVLAGLQLRYGILPLPQDAYYIDTAPVELRALDFVWVAGLAVLLCTLAAWLPARVAARIEPIKSIRFGG